MQQGAWRNPESDEGSQLGVLRNHHTPNHLGGFRQCRCRLPGEHVCRSFIGVVKRRGYDVPEGGFVLVERFGVQGVSSLVLKNFPGPVTLQTRTAYFNQAQSELNLTRSCHFWKRSLLLQANSLCRTSGDARPAAATHCSLASTQVVKDIRNPIH